MGSNLPIPVQHRSAPGNTSLMNNKLKSNSVVEYHFNGGRLRIQLVPPRDALDLAKLITCDLLYCHVNLGMPTTILSHALPASLQYVHPSQSDPRDNAYAFIWVLGRCRLGDLDIFDLDYTKSVETTFTEFALVAQE
jgi:hypothetical protein